MLRQRAAQIELSDEGRKTFAQTVRKELLATLADEDLTDRKLMHMQTLIQVTLPLFRSGIPRGRSGVGSYYSPMAVNVNTVDFDGDDEVGLGLEPNVLSGAPLQETFGAKALRELVSSIPKLLRPPPTLVELVTSAAAAKTAGMTELQQSIEEQIALRMKQGPPEETAPAGFGAPPLFERQDHHGGAAADSEGPALQEASS